MDGCPLKGAEWLGTSRVEVYFYGIGVQRPKRRGVLPGARLLQGPPDAEPPKARPTAIISGNTRRIGRHSSS